MNQGFCFCREMCLKWWFSHQPKMRVSTGGEDDNIASTSGASGLFSSTGLSASSTSTSTSSVGRTRIKDLLPQRPLLYNRSEIASATLSFASTQQIGSSSWQGVLRGSLVAIVQKPGVAKDFNRLLRKMHVLNHRSLAKVAGGCAAGNCVFVVYELVHGDNLQSCLCNTRAPGYTVLSTWRLRMQVAVDVANGLEYLHQHGSIFQSAHKYLTSRNVMITNEALRAKVVMVGMSVLTGEVTAREADRDLPQNEDEGQRKKRLVSSSSIKIKGTHGYMPPEYALSGAISYKYDVFTYGIVLLELLKGEGLGQEQKLKARRISIVHEARSIFSGHKGDRGLLRLWVDRRLNDSYPVDDAMKVVRLALLCVDENPDKRPTMTEVALRMAQFLQWAEIWENERSSFTGTATLEGR